MKKQQTEEAKGFSIRLLGVWLTFIALVLIFTWLTHRILLDEERHFDEWIYHAFAGFTTPGLTSFVGVLTFFGSTDFLFPAYFLLCLYFLFFKKDRRQSWSIAAIGLTSVGLLNLMKNLIRRPRPLHPLTENYAGFSYPSGHSFSSFTLAGICIYIVWKSKMPPWLKWLSSIAIFLFAASIAASRVYLHVHYASDVIGGFCLSVLWLMICFYLLDRWYPEKPLT